MNKEPVVAVVGATGLIGKELVEIIAQREFPYSEIRLLDLSQAEGEVIEVDDDELEVERVSDESFEGVDIAFFATDDAISDQYVPIAQQSQAVVIDSSSNFKLQQDVPLVIPEVNGHLLSADTKLISMPCPSTIQLCLVLSHIQKAAGLKRVVVSTYESVSGAGKQALDELWDQSLALFNQTELPQEHFSAQIAFNCIPQVDVFLSSGYTKEEMKIVNETRKILELPKLAITATAVRVPVFHAHAVSVNIETENELNPDQLLKLLEGAAGIEIFPAHDIYPMQILAAGSDLIQVGRVRKDESVKHGLDLWIVADNLRKGAALNAIQVAEELLKLS